MRLLALSCGTQGVFGRCNHVHKQACPIVVSKAYFLVATVQGFIPDLQGKTPNPVRCLLDEKSRFLHTGMSHAKHLTLNVCLDLLVVQAVMHGSAGVNQQHWQVLMQLKSRFLLAWVMLSI